VRGCAALVQVVADRRRLAGDVADRRLYQPDRDAIPPDALGDGATHGAHRIPVLAPHVHDQLLGADRLRRDEPAVDHQVRAEMHERAVLRDEGLTLGAVGYDIRTVDCPYGY